MPDDLPKIMPREAVPAQKRKPLTRRQFAELILAQEGRCGCGCNERLKADEIVDEHLHALSLGGGNELSNRSLWRKQCSQRKTDTFDKPLAAKGARIRGETGTGPKRKINSRNSFLSLNPRGAANFGGLKSRGFDKTKTRKFSGKVVPR